MKNVTYKGETGVRYAGVKYMPDVTHKVSNDLAGDLDSIPDHNFLIEDADSRGTNSNDNAPDGEKG